MKIQGTGHTDKHFVFLFLPAREMDLSQVSGLSEDDKEGRLFAPLKEAPEGPMVPYAFWYARDAFALKVAEADASRAAQSTGDNYLERVKWYVEIWRLTSGPMHGTSAV